MHIKIYCFFLLFFSSKFFATKRGQARILYVSVEHCKILLSDRRYVANAVFSCRRYGRHSPVHYMSVDGDILIYAGNNVSVSLYYYEFLTNTYKRSFLEFEMKLCDFFERTPLIKEFMKRKVVREQLKDIQLCPLIPKHYVLTNLTVPPGLLPKTFPFKKGRLYANITWTDTKKPIVCTSLDFELKPLYSNLSLTDLLIEK